MNKTLHVALYEYKRHVFRRRFLISLLSVPLFILLMGLVVILLVRAESSGDPIGFVDNSGVLSDVGIKQEDSGTSDEVEIIRYEMEEDAASSLQAGDIQAYYVLESDFVDSARTRLVSKEGLATSIQRQFMRIVRARLLAGQPTEVIQRINEGDNLVLRSPDGSRRLGERDWFNVLLPFLAGLIFLVTIFSTSGYLMQAVVEEKENRTIEVLVTSITSGQLMAGKISGIIAVGLTQLLGWLGLIILVATVGRFQFAWLLDINIAPDLVLLLLVILIPAFIMVSALMAAIGSVVNEASEGQQLSALVTLPMTIPFWFVLLIMNDPNGTVPVALSVFPLTAPIALTIRSGFTVIPTWQILISVGILILSAFLAIWFAGRAFRQGMLLYGRRLSLKEVFRR